MCPACIATIGTAAATGSVTVGGALAFLVGLFRRRNQKKTEKSNE